MRSEFQEDEYIFEGRQTKYMGKFDFMYDYTSHWLSLHGYITRVCRSLVKPLNKLQVLFIGKSMTMTGRRSDWTLAAGTGVSEPPHDSYEMAFPLEHCEAATKLIMNSLEDRGIPYPWCEIRISGPSPAWLSPAYGRHVCWFELPTYHQNEETHEYILMLMQKVAEKYEGRPHWGKLNVYSSPPLFLRSVYPKFDDFVRVVKDMDPLGTYSSPWFDRIFNLNSNQISPPSVVQEADKEISMIPLMDNVFAPFHHAVLLIFARLCLFDFIDSRASVSLDDIADHTQWSKRATSAMLISLATSNILDASVGPSSTSYSLTRLGKRFLSTKNHGYVNDFLDLFWNVSPQALLDKAIEDQKENFMLETGGGAPSEAFISAMQGQTSFAAQVLTRVMPFETVHHMVDVGGGSGTLAIQACSNNDHISASVYELPGVVPITEKYIMNANLTNRIKVVPGNMFEDEYYPEADAYAFGNVLHDWPDKVNMGLLAKAYKSLPSNGTVIILEMLIAEDIVSTTQAAAGLNLVMVTNEQGRQYKASDLEKMLSDVGFVDTAVYKSNETPYSAIVSKKRRECCRRETFTSM